MGKERAIDFSVCRRQFPGSRLDREISSTPNVRQFSAAPLLELVVMYPKPANIVSRGAAHPN